MSTHWSVSPREAIRDLRGMIIEARLYLNPANVGSPFEHGSRNRKLLHLLAVLVIAALHVIVMRWAILEFRHPSNFQLEHMCDLYPIITLAFVAIAASIFIFSSTWIIVHARLKPVFLPRKFRLPPPIDSEKWPNPYHPTNITEAMNIIKRLGDQAEEDPDMQNEPTEFLRSRYGQQFLYDIAHRVRRLRLRKGRMVRREKWKYLLLGSVISLCLWVAIGGSRKKSDKCLSAELVMGFLEIISITLITLVSVCSFLGYNEYVRLVSESIKEHPLTHDEKFLISLLALNTDDYFNGFKKTQIYANVDKEGDIHAFIPLSTWLCVYRLATVDAV